MMRPPKPDHIIDKYDELLEQRSREMKRFALAVLAAAFVVGGLVALFSN